jgi:hypothetical protein
MVQSNLSTFAAAGMAPGQGFNFASIENVVDTAERFATDEKIHGRVIAILPGEGEGEHVVDLGDDEEGLWGGVVFKRCQERMRKEGNII